MPRTLLKRQAVAPPGLLLLLALLLTSAACGANRETALIRSDKELMAGSQQGDFQKANEEGDAAWAERMERPRLEAALASWEKAATIETPNLSEAERRLALYEVYLKLARGYYFLADSHIRLAGEPGSQDEAMMDTYNRGVTAAEKALAIYSPDFAKAIQYEKPMPEAIQLIDKGGVGAMYWYATNVGKWALLAGFAEVLSRKDNIKAIMDRVEELDPLYFHAAPYRYFGAYYTKLPFPGGDPPKSRQYFDKAIAASPDYLATRVLLAEMLATKIEDKELYRQQLEFVLAYDAAKVPELLPENTFEQRKAKLLLAEIDDRF